MGLLGLLSNLPFLLGPVVGVVGVVLAHGLRRTPTMRVPELALVPALGALAVLVFASPAEIASGLVAGLAALAFLLWLADDPRRAPGGGRRAVAIIGLSAVGFGLVWGITLLVPPGAQDIGVAGALAAGALLLIVPVLVLPGAREAPETA